MDYNANKFLRSLSAAPVIEQKSRSECYELLNNFDFVRIGWNIIKDRSCASQCQSNIVSDVKMNILCISENMAYKLGLGALIPKKDDRNT